MKLYEEIQKAVIIAFPELSEAGFDFQPTPENQPGDIGLACFRFAKAMGTNPPAAAAKIVTVVYPSIILKAELAGPYVNFTLDRDTFSSGLLGDVLLKGESFGSENSGKGKKVILEHTSINPNASPHIGRARNGLIGDSLARMLRFEGFDVNVHYYVNDMGKQIGLLVMQTEEIEKLDFKEVLDLYVKANKRAEEDPDFEQRGIALLSKMENSEPEVVQAFSKLVDICLNGQLAVLSRLGFKYDTFDRESSFLKDPSMNEILVALKSKDALFTDEQGRKVVDLQRIGYKLEEGRYVVLVRANGSSMYMFRDIAYTLEKMKRGADYNIIILGEDHKMYFEQLTAIIGAMGKTLPEAVHYSYIILKEGKMSTRQGTVVLLEDFLDEAIRLARERVEEQCTDLTEEERAEIAEIIGIGAVKFTVLSVRPNRNVVFDWESALSFTGDSGPYIQYSCTRIASILRKYGNLPESGFNGMTVSHDAEWRLILRLSAVSDDIEEALQSRNPAMIATVALDVARKFSIFYNECQVLNAPDEKIRLSRIYLCVAVRRVLINLLGLLGIEAPNRM